MAAGIVSSSSRRALDAGIGGPALAGRGGRGSVQRMAAVRSLSGLFSSIGPARQKLHQNPMPLATLKAPVPTMNRYDALGEHIGPECAPESARMRASEEFPLAIDLKPSKLSKKRNGTTILSSSICSTLATLVEKLSEHILQTVKKAVSATTSTSPPSEKLASHQRS